jgi:hemerythrin-like domain-containing protein
MRMDPERRKLLEGSAILGVAVATTGFPGSLAALQKAPPAKAQEKEPEVTATEDLMREHGVIRRALLVYAESAPRLRQNAAGVDPSALRQTAQLFRTFGEDYHEKMLEEQHIFPLVRKQGAVLERYADILIAQHARGRKITDYILAVTNGPKIGVTHNGPLADVLQGFVRMYENHAAREDTIIFPAWKKNFTDRQLDEISDQFEDIEHKMFGKDGFEDAEKKIGGIEGVLGLADLAQFTAPAPPKP